MLVSIPNIKEIYVEYYDRAFLFVRSYVYEKEAVEDIVSESLIKLWMELKNSERETHNLKAFLFSILRSKSLDYLRHQAMKNKVLNRISSIDQGELDLRIASLLESEYNDILVQEIQSIVQASLSEMNSKTREVYELSRFEYLTNKEIAEKLNISIKGVEYHMNIALRLLRENLKDYMHHIFYLYFFL